MLSKAARPDNSGKSRLAGKKIMIYLTIASLLNLVGCYYQQQMSPEEYTFDENLNLEVTTKDTTYSLNANDYYYDKDTLFVTTSKFIYKNNYRVRVTDKVIAKIPGEEIEMIQVEESDSVGSILVITGVVVIILGTLLIIALADYSAHF